MFPRRCILMMSAAAAGLSLSHAPVRATDDAPPPPKKITTVEGITEYRLGNGLQVLLFPDESKPTVTVNITYFVGSRHEGYGETGMAHLLEHMVFKGTPTHPQIWKLLQDHGAQFNGTTWLDRTNYFETLAASDENLEFALQLEADRMINSFIAEKDLKSEFSVVRNEFEMGENNPVGILSERMASTAFLWHNYGKSTIGSREDIERVPIDRLQAFYRKYYQPDNAMLVVAGKFDAERTLKRINEIYGAIPRPQRVLDRTYTVEPPQDGEREVILRRVGDVQAVGALYHICAGSHEDMPAVEVMEDVLTSDQTGRLYKALVETQLATRVTGSAYSLFDPGMLEFMASVRLEKSLDEVRRVMMVVLDSLGKQSITDEEVNRAKNKFAKNFELLMNDSGRVGITLSESAASGDWRLMFLHRDRMARVTPADVQRVAAHYLKPSNRTIGMFVPTKEVDRTSVPPTPDIAMLLKDYKGKEAVETGEAFEATYAAIEARTQREALPVGMKLALLPKKTRGQRVNASLTLHYGAESSLKGRTEAADFIGAMLMCGTKKHTREQIRDELDRLKARVFIGGGGGRGRMGASSSSTPGALSVGIETTRPNLTPVLQLVAELLRESTFPEKEFEKLHKQELSGLEEQRSEPMTLARIELRRRMTPVDKDNIRYVPSLDEQIGRVKAVTLDDVKKVYQELIGAGNAEMAIVGDFDASEVRNLLGSLFADWKSDKPFERIERPYLAAKPDRAAINTPDKANALFTIGLNLELRDDDPDYPAAFMANFILGGNANSRLLNRIRQKEGLSYGCGSALQASPQDRAGYFIAYGICAPQNAEKAVACAVDEIEKLLKDGVTQKELDDARKGYREQVKVGLSNDAAVAGALAQNAYLGRTLKFNEEQLKKIEALTVDDVNTAARKYIKAENLIVVSAGDFDAAAGLSRESSGKK